MLEQQLNIIALELVNMIKLSFVQKDYVVSGQTRDSIRQETSKKGFKIFGASYINSLESGRPPRENNQETDFLERLIRWVEGRGLAFGDDAIRLARQFRYLINRFGTRLYRSQDPRFSGNQSGLISDVINDEYITKLKKTISKILFSSFKVNFKRYTNNI